MDGCTPPWWPPSRPPAASRADRALASFVLTETIMLTRLARLGGLMLVFALAAAAPASAQIVQALHINGGVFMPRGYDGRAAGDVLVEDFNSLEFPACLAPD